ncbi:MAG: YdcF family protein [Candidatus Kerfeldbacteria bacterium]
MFDAIVVFGGGISPDGSLEENSRVRVKKAIRLWNDKLAPVIVMSGAWASSSVMMPLRTEAAAMAELAEQLGCPSSCILKEEQSKETIGNAYFVKTLFAIPRKWRSLVIVAADYHIPRTRQICHKVFGPDYHLTFESAPLPMTIDERKERDIGELARLSIFNEWIDAQPGDHRAIWGVLSTIHPAYSKHPKYSREDIVRLIAERIVKLRAERIGS